MTSISDRVEIPLHSMTHAQFQNHDLHNKNVCGSSSPQIPKETLSLFHSALLQYAPTISLNHSITPKQLT